LNGVFEGQSEVWNMTTPSKYLFAAVTSAILLAFSAVSASAAYACVGSVCWMDKEKYRYPAASKVVIRKESWKPGPRVTIREPGEGRGYYRRDVWTSF
jgi:hypothetical protein